MEKKTETVVTKTTSGGLGVGSIMGFIFLVLKLVGVIDWPWIWVLCPFWIPLAMVVVVLAVFLVFALIAGIIAAIAGVFSK